LKITVHLKGRWITQELGNHFPHNLYESNNVLNYEAAGDPQQKSPVANDDNIQDCYL